MKIAVSNLLGHRQILKNACVFVITIIIFVVDVDVVVVVDDVDVSVH